MRPRNGPEVLINDKLCRTERNLCKNFEQSRQALYDLNWSSLCSRVNFALPELFPTIAQQHTWFWIIPIFQYLTMTYMHLYSRFVYGNQCLCLWSMNRSGLSVYTHSLTSMKMTLCDLGKNSDTWMHEQWGCKHEVSSYLYTYVFMCKKNIIRLQEMYNPTK